MYVWSPIPRTALNTVKDAESTLYTVLSEDSSLLWCYAVWGKQFPGFWRTVMPSSSEIIILLQIIIFVFNWFLLPALIHQAPHSYGIPIDTTKSQHFSVHISTLLSRLPPTLTFTTNLQAVLQTSQPVHWGPTTCTWSLYENSCNIKSILIFSIIHNTLCLIIYYLATSLDLEYRSSD